MGECITVIKEGCAWVFQGQGEDRDKNDWPPNRHAAANQGLYLPMSHLHLGGAMWLDLTSRMYAATTHAMSRPMWIRSMCASSTPNSPSASWTKGTSGPRGCHHLAVGRTRESYKEPDPTHHWWGAPTVGWYLKEKSTFCVKSQPLGDTEISLNNPETGDWRHRVKAWLDSEKPALNLCWNHKCLSPNGEKSWKASPPKNHSLDQLSWLAVGLHWN